ncbi:MAG: hypothetical protein DCC71_18945 [Proteobacteria bacterium]|nr:MAG: hypothetical protein DCC71_18945 [Pseudomonadota bacterium]
MTAPQRCIASHAAPSDYAPTCRVLLAKLGYALLPPEEAPQPDVRIVREERIGEATEPAVPLIVLTSGRIERVGDPRITGRVKRPAGLHEIYKLLQTALEPNPRAVPRVPARLAGRALGDDGQHWELVVESLSENGCLVSGEQLPPFDAAFTLTVEMPWGERISVPADVAYEQGDRLGLVFHGITLGARRQLAKLVVKLLERL